MRISRHQMWMGMASLAAQRSTCYRGNVGCVIVRDDRDVMAIGYNGPPSGDDHCKGNDCETNADGGCRRSIHAEENALRRLPHNLMLAHDTQLDLYVTSNPCPSCAERIVEYGHIQRVFYQSPYRIKAGIPILNAGKIQVLRLSPSGYLVDEETGKVLETN